MAVRHGPFLSLDELILEVSLECEEAGWFDAQGVNGPDQEADILRVRILAAAEAGVVEPLLDTTDRELIQVTSEEDPNNRTPVREYRLPLITINPDNFRQMLRNDPLRLDRLDAPGFSKNGLRFADERNGKFHTGDLLFDWVSVRNLLRFIGIQFNEHDIEDARNVRTRDDPLSLQLTEYLHKVRENGDPPTAGGARAFVLDDPEFDDNGDGGLLCPLFSDIERRINVSWPAFRKRFNRKVRQLGI